MAPDDLAADVALVARVLARLGFVHAFGHVSARSAPGAVDSPARPDSGSATLPHRGTRQRRVGLERDPLERDRVERHRLERHRVERDPLERDPLERDRLERDRLERDRVGGGEGRVLVTRRFRRWRIWRPGICWSSTRAGGGAGGGRAAAAGGAAAPGRVRGPAGGRGHLPAAWPGGRRVRGHRRRPAAAARVRGDGGAGRLLADPDLVAAEPAAGRVAAALGGAPAMLLAGNGGLTVGTDLDQALARAWCLEDRCRVALAAGDRGRPLDPEALGRRRRWYDAETVRLARWLRATAG